METLARSHPDVTVTPAELDQDPFLFNCANGTIDLKTGKLEPHNPADLITQISPVNYDPEATCPTWDRFLDETVSGRIDVSLYLQQSLGMGLSGDISEQILSVWHGDGSNGKNTMIEAVLEVLE